MPPSPSLRRTFSSPTVRSSPYPATLSVSSSSLNSQSAIAARGGGSHRRSTGSETSNRRVLAEIDWWTVTEGQLDLEVDAPSGNIATPVIDHVTFAAFTPEFESVWFTGFPTSPETPRTLELPTAEMEALSLSGSRHSRDSSVSSIESSPEMPMTPLDAPVADAGLARPTDWFLPPLKRSFTTPLILSTDVYDMSLPDFDDTDYADYSVSPLSSVTPILMN